MDLEKGETADYVDRERDAAAEVIRVEGEMPPSRIKNSIDRLMKNEVASGRKILAVFTGEGEVKLPSEEIDTEEIDIFLINDRGQTKHLKG